VLATLSSRIPWPEYLTRLCKSVVNIEKKHSVLERALLKRRINCGGDGHVDGCWVPRNQRSMD